VGCAELADVQVSSPLIQSQPQHSLLSLHVPVFEFDLQHGDQGHLDLLSAWSPAQPITATLSTAVVVNQVYLHKCINIIERKEESRLSTVIIKIKN